MKWFRLYNNVRHNPKVQNLSPQLFRFWINLLCLANDQPERGTIKSLDIIVTDLGIRRDVVERFTLTLGESLLLQRLTNGSLVIHDWDTLQPSSDDSKARVKRHREKLCVNEKIPSCNGSVTKCNALDSDRDREKDPPLYIPPPTKELVLPSTPRRTPEDATAVEAARLILAGGLDTEPIARELDRLEDQPGYVTTPGWKFHVAAERQVLLSDPGKRRSPRYFFAVARGIGDDEKPRPAPPKKAPEEVAEDWTRRMREEREKEKPKVDPEYAKQLAQYNEIMRRHHERGRKL